MFKRELEFAIVEQIGTLDGAPVVFKARVCADGSISGEYEFNGSVERLTEYSDPQVRMLHEVAGEIMQDVDSCVEYGDRLCA
jgi:hypothetical protein